MRIGIFGGSFDPVHYGHLLLAVTAIETLELDDVRLIPAAQSPLKPKGPVAAAAERLEMLRLACGGTEQLIVDSREAERGGVSYTVDTLQEVKQQYPQAELFLLMGGDALASIRQWHQPERLLQLATAAVVRRGGEGAIDFSPLRPLVDAELLQRIQQATIPMPQCEISSTDLRQRVARGASIRFRTPRAVEAYIDAAGLYRIPPPGAVT